MTQTLFAIALIIKLLTFGQYTFYDGAWVRISDKSFYSTDNRTWYAVSRSYWESYSKTHTLTVNDINKLKLLGWGDLVK